MFNPRSHEHPHRLPRVDTARCSARHDANVAVAAFHGVDNVGEVFSSLAVERDIDMIVMGCVDHSRLREVLPGGVSLTALLR